MRTCPFCAQDIPVSAFACSEHWHRLTTDQRHRINKAYVDFIQKRLTAEALKELHERVIDAAGVAWNEDVAGRNQPCRSCGAPVFFAPTEKGSVAPIDFEPREDGNIILRFGVAVVLTAEQKGVDLFGQRKYVSHFSTCPHAAQHRKEKK